MGFLSGIKAMRAAAADPEAAWNAERDRLAGQLDTTVRSYLGPLHAAGLYEGTLEAAVLPAGWAMSRRTERRRTAGLTDRHSGRVAYLVLGADDRLHLYSVLFGHDASVRADRPPMSWQRGEATVAITTKGGATSVTLTPAGEPPLQLEVISLFRYGHFAVERFARDLGIEVESS